MKSPKNYDKKVKLTRILLSDYLVLKKMSQVAGVPMAEALHRLIEHQAQLPLLDMRAKPMSAIAIQPMPILRITGRSPVIQVAPVLSIAVNGTGAQHSAFKIKPKGVRNE